MDMPRMVECRVTHGRSVPVSIKGVMHRMRAGDEPLSIPFGVYQRHAWKMELVGESINQVRTAMMAGDDIQTTAPIASIPKQPTTVEEGPGEVPLWDLKVSPEEYISLYGKKKKVSKTVQQRLDLARKLTAEG